MQSLNVYDFGAIGDGISDDTFAIQSAIKYCFDNNIHNLNFENDKVYLCNKEIVLYGKNLSINGNNSVIKRTTGFIGVFGAILNIYGLTPNLNYPLLGDYVGEVSAAENIVITDLAIYCSEDISSSTYINGLAVCNSKNIIIKNIKVTNAPQTAFAIVSSSLNNKDLIIDNVLLDNCISKNSKKHSFRLSSIKESKIFSAKIINCSAINVVERESGYNAKGRKVHLLCNVSSNNVGNYRILIDCCHFDDSGEVYIVQNCTNIVIQNSQLMGGLEINNPNSMITSNIVIQNNEFNYATDNNSFIVPLLLYNMKNINIKGNVFTNIFKDMVGIYNVCVNSCEDIVFNKNYNFNLLVSKVNRQDINNKNITIINNYISATNNMISSVSSKSKNLPILNIKYTDNTTIENNTIIDSTIVTNPSPRAEPTKNISIEDIKYLQKCLNLMKIRDVNNNPLALDGNSGPLTISAIKKLQGILGLSIFGPEVLSEVKSIMEKPLCSLNHPEHKTAIRYIQWRIGKTIDGIYGDVTVRLVKAYQKNNKLVADGIVGKETWQYLLS